MDRNHETEIPVLIIVFLPAAPFQMTELTASEGSSLDRLNIFDFDFDLP